MNYIECRNLVRYASFELLRSRWRIALLMAWIPLCGGQLYAVNPPLPEEKVPAKVTSTPPPATLKKVRHKPDSGRPPIQVTVTWELEGKPGYFIPEYIKGQPEPPEEEFEDWGHFADGKEFRGGQAKEFTIEYPKKITQFMRPETALLSSYGEWLNPETNQREQGSTVSFTHEMKMTRTGGGDEPDGAPGGPGGNGNSGPPPKSPLPPSSPPNHPAPPSPRATPIPDLTDFDEDGLSNYRELKLGTNQFNPDSDGDGTDDGWEVGWKLKPLDPNDASLDYDQDGLTNRQEYNFNSNPYSADGDAGYIQPQKPGDGIPDIWEVRTGSPALRANATEPLFPRWPMTVQQLFDSSGLTEDADGDGLADAVELIIGTNVALLDSDSDGLPDDWESVNGFNPILSSTPSVNSDDDSDEVSDRSEYTDSLTPYAFDTDGDSLSDGWELRFGLDPKGIYFLKLRDWLPLTGLYSTFSLTPKARDGIATGPIGYGDNAIRLSHSLPLYGAPSYILIPGTHSEMLEPAMAVSFWISAVGSETAAKRGGVILQKPDSFKLSITSAGNLKLSLKKSNGWMDSVSPIPLVFDTWHRITLRVNEAGVLNLFAGGMTHLSANLNDVQVSMWPWILGSERTVPRQAIEAGISDYRAYEDVSDAEFLVLLDLLSNPNSTHDENLADIDSDGLNYRQEYAAGSLPDVVDTDEDGIPDGEEVNVHHTRAYRADSDSDGIGDAQEVADGSNPMAVDSDNDGLPDYVEKFVSFSNPMLADTDGDGMQDDYEHEYGLNIVVNDSGLDHDDDGLNNLQESQQVDNNGGSDPTNPWVAGRPSDFDTDTDSDGLSDYEELFVYQTDPHNAHSLNDDFTDGESVDHDLFPPDPDDGSTEADGDFDGDGMSNADEIAQLRDPSHGLTSGAKLTGAHRLREIPKVKRPKNNDESGMEEFGSGSVRIQAPDGGSFFLKQDKDESEIGVVGTLVLSGKAAGRNDIIELELTRPVGELKVSAERLKNFKGAPVERAYELTEAHKIISGFINQLERDDEGFVTVNASLLTAVEYEEDILESDPDSDWLGSFRGGWTGTGWGGPAYAGNGGDFALWSVPWASGWLAEIDKTVDGQYEEASRPLYGSTALFVGGIGADMDIISASGREVPDQDESSVGGRVSIMGPNGETPNSAAVIRVFPVGAQEAERTITWNESLVVVKKNGGVVESPLTLWEVDGTVHLQVWGKPALVSGQGGSVTFSLATNTAHNDSVVAKFSSYELDVSNARSKALAADHFEGLDANSPFNAFQASVIMYEPDEEGIIEPKPAGDGSVVEWEFLSDSGLDSGTIDGSTTTVDGNTASTAFFNPVLKEDSNGLRRVPRIHKIQAKLVKVVHSDNSEEIVVPSEENGLLVKSGLIAVFPGAPSEIEILGGEIAPLPADGTSTFELEAIAKDRFGNCIPDDVPVEWVAEGSLAIRSRNVIENGKAQATFEMPERMDDDGVGGFKHVYTVRLACGNAVSPPKSVGRKPTSVTVTRVGGTSADLDLSNSIDYFRVEAVFSASGGGTVADGTPVHWMLDNGSIADKSVWIKDGKATALVRVEGGHIGPGTLSCSAADAPVAVHQFQVVSGGKPYVKLVSGSRALAGDRNASGSQVVVVETPEGEVSVPIHTSATFEIRVPQDKIANYGSATVRVGFGYVGAESGPPSSSHYMDAYYDFVPANRLVTLVNGVGQFTVLSKGVKPVETDSNGFAIAEPMPISAAFVTGVKGNAPPMAIVGDKLATLGAKTAAIVTNAVKGAVMGADEFDGADALAGDLVASFCFVGDVRDIFKEGYKGMVLDEDVDNFTLGMATFGLLTNFPSPAVALEVPVSLAKVMGKVVKGKPLARLNYRLMAHLMNETLKRSPKAAAKLMGGYFLAYGVILGADDAFQFVVPKIIQFSSRLQQWAEEDNED